MRAVVTKMYVECLCWDPIWCVYVVVVVCVCFLYPSDAFSFYPSLNAQISRLYTQIPSIWQYVFFLLLFHLLHAIKFNIIDSMVLIPLETLRSLSLSIFLVQPDHVQAHTYTHTQSKKTLILMSLIKSNNIQIYGFIALEWIIITKIRPTNSHCVYLLVRPIWSRVDWCYDIRYTSTEMVPTKTRIQRDVMKIQLGQIYIIQLLYGYHRISLITIENRFFPLSARAPQAWQAVC